MGFIIAILGLGIVIFVHELGHMIAAKKSGIGVYEFSIGMGPKLWSRTRGETMYSIRLLPFGGFVKLAGLDDDDDHPVDPGLMFQNKPFFNRFATIAAGALVNIVFGFLLYYLLFVGFGMPVFDSKIEKVIPDTPAAMAGLVAGDNIIAIDGQTVDQADVDIVARIHGSEGAPFKLTYDRGGQKSTIQLSAVQSEDNKSVHLIGIQLGVKTRRYDPITGIGKSFERTVLSIQQVFLSLKLLVTREVGVKGMLGPLGIIQLTSSQMSKGAFNLINILALINVSLGVVNLFPFPVLDGGHLMFLLIEAIRRKPLNKKVETLVNNMGAVFLITLMVLIVFNDIVNWQDRVQLFN